MEYLADLMIMLSRFTITMTAVEMTARSSMEDNMIIDTPNAELLCGFSSEVEVKVVGLILEYMY